MLTFFRNFFKTKIGLALVLAFLVLIGFAFASMDVSSTGAFGGVAGGNRVAVVGDEKIGTAELSRAATEELERVRQENPTATMQTFLAGDGLNDALASLINRIALVEWTRDFGLRAGDNLLNSEIRQIPAAAGPSGAFDENSYRAFLAREQLTDQRLRELLGASLLAQQTLIPAGFGATIPESIARTYARSFKERREGSVALLPAEAFAPTGAPTDAQLTAFYEENRSRFVRPERRVIEYALFDASSLGDAIEPTDAEITAYFRQNAARYAASQTRSFTQLIVPTQAAAQSIAERVRGGTSLAQAAQGGGLRTTAVNDASRADIREQASEAVASAYFAAAQGAVTSPARSPLGWHIAQVRSVDTTPARTLAQARDEIVTALREEKRVALLSDLSISIEDQLADGATLAEVARERGVSVQRTPPVLANGQLYGRQENAPEALAQIIPVTFQMEEGEPEIGALPGGGSYVVYQVGDIAPSATAPLAQIRDQVIRDWRQLTGAQRAEQAAARIVKKVEAGASLSQALASEDVTLPPIDDVNISRQELAQLGDRQVPAPIALLFGMAQGSVKKLEIPRNNGWFVVELEDVELDRLDDSDPLIAQANRQLGQAWGSEYGEQLAAAMQADVGVERNADAIEAVRRQLLGEN
ncbi:peptidylprolyl isomerase [Erythrobacter litoralis]|uniref:peptidyl-prolyl cis-trans isomerase n=1 Tax=Erythrobacter litoralis TaxID=39960 RepID=UPI002435B065|nr:peptidyl-prolyl cis-trans isomerase [Erythrobacter litoralis]MDG6078221.1 peptidylprolyl isomerase [Erythrobacter litoralis]